MSLHRAEWTLFIVSAFLAALFCAWQALASVNFLYPVWYEVLSIDETIATYGPKNHYRRDFEATTKAERVRLFSEIVTAIQNQGKGLNTLVYHDPDGRPIAPLLTGPEILHLQDVARLIDRLKPVGWGALLVALAVAGLLWLQRAAMPSLRTLLLALLSGLGGMTLLILLIGPVTVFYRLHTWIFPAGHAWFFYYEDSLMTTMMKAPDLFGYIALSLLLLTLLFLFAILWIVRILYPHFSSQPANARHLP